MSYTLDYLTKEVDTILKENGFTREVSIETVGGMLCGMNWKLAEEPFSKEFITNVSYNSPISFKLVLWLQLNALENISSFDYESFPMSAGDELM